MAKQYTRLAKLILSVTRSNLEPALLSHWLGKLKSGGRMPAQMDALIREFYMMAPNIIGARHIIRKHIANPKFDPMDAVFHTMLDRAAKDPEKNFMAAFLNNCKPRGLDSFGGSQAIRRALEDGVAPPAYNPDKPISERPRKGVHVQVISDKQMYYPFNTSQSLH